MALDWEAGGEMERRLTLSRAVTFVPGAAGAGAFWLPVVQCLPASWDIDVLDLPGLGAVPSRENIATYDDLVAYVKARIARPTVLVAQSMGAYIALSVALRHPDAVTHLVLVAATGGVEVSALGAVDWRAEHLCISHRRIMGTRFSARSDRAAP